jgi:hypothetical protein
MRKRCIASQDDSDASPKRSVVVLPGLGNNSQDYAAVAQALQARGLHVQTAAVARADWCVILHSCPPFICKYGLIIWKCLRCNCVIQS